MIVPPSKMGLLSTLLGMVVLFALVCQASSDGAASSCTAAEKYELDKCELVYSGYSGNCWERIVEMCNNTAFQDVHNWAENYANCVTAGWTCADCTNRNLTMVPCPPDEVSIFLLDDNPELTNINNAFNATGGHLDMYNDLF